MNLCGCHLQRNDTNVFGGDDSSLSNDDDTVVVTYDDPEISDSDDDLREYEQQTGFALSYANSELTRAACESRILQWF